jgi:riboflavin synthase
MFTGLIEDVGRVLDIVHDADGIRLRIATAMARELSTGDSVAINGVCLTATGVGDDIRADIGPETARVTTLGRLCRDQPVNIERSMRADSRFGGHFVQGHVDGVGAVAAIREDGDAHWLTIAFPSTLAPFLIHKGSIAVDGISLTVATLDECRFDVMIIPFTWQHTSVSSLRVGDRVNLECDMIGKYVARVAELSLAGRLKAAPTTET